MGPAKTLAQNQSEQQSVPNDFVLDSLGFVVDLLQAYQLRAKNCFQAMTIPISSHRSCQQGIHQTSVK